MMDKLFGWLVLLVFVASLTWYFRDTQTVGQWRPSIEKGLHQLGVDTATVRRYWTPTADRLTSPAPRSGTTGVPTSPAGVHRCNNGGETIYTDLPCPTGSQKQTGLKGNVTVIEALRVPDPPPPPAASTSPAQQAQTLRQQAIERVINQLPTP